MDKYELEELHNLNVVKITQLIGGVAKKGNWTLTATLYGEYAIATPKEQYCPKGQDKIRHPHYEFSISLKKDALNGHSAFKKIKKVINENYTIFNL